MFIFRKQKKGCAETAVLAVKSYRRNGKPVRDEIVIGPWRKCRTRAGAIKWLRHQILDDQQTLDDLKLWEPLSKKRACQDAATKRRLKKRKHLIDLLNDDINFSDV
jgi:hypothetical protein